MREGWTGGASDIVKAKCSGEDPRATARTSCRLSLPPALLPARQNQLPDAVRWRNPSKFTLAHDAVAAAVSHKHHSIIRVGTGLIQFVHGAHSRLAAEATRTRNPFSPFFAQVFSLLNHFCYKHLNSSFRNVTERRSPRGWSVIKCREIQRKILWNELCPLHEITEFT